MPPPWIFKIEIDFGIFFITSAKVRVDLYQKYYVYDVIVPYFQNIAYKVNDTVYYFQGR